ETRRQEKPQELTDQDQSQEESQEGEEGEEGEEVEEGEEDSASEVTKRRPRHHHGISGSNKSSYLGHPLSE
ncbi:hypothetical protein, partial [Salmonella enterica]|uniref:hypothetical protein n=1 Tax=Salmonella enterica TaxID=28901 RepID=UPI003296C0ED